MACPECDLLQRRTALKPDASAHCPRCRTELYRPTDDNLDRPLAYTLSAGVLFIIANMYPIVGLELQGQSSSATLWGTVLALHDQHMTMLAVLVGFTTILVPGLQLAAMSYVLVLLHMGQMPAHLPLALRTLQALRPWGMVEVFILGLLVSLVKLAGTADVVPGIALWSFGGLLFMIAAAVASFDARAIWARQEISPAESR